MSVAPIGPIESAPLLDRASITQIQPAAGSAGVTGPQSFSQLLANGIENVSDKQVSADKMVRAFALDDSIPVHQVTYALQQAKMSLDLALQVRSRLLDGFQQLMNMQL